MAESSDNDPLANSLRKFLRQVGVTSQRAIEEAASEARARGATTLTVRGKTYPANHAPILVFPNPLNPKRYVVINSGLTFRAPRTLPVLFG